MEDFRDNIYGNGREPQPETPIEDSVTRIYAESIPQEEESRNAVKIDLSGGARPHTEEKKTGAEPYTEHIKKAKKEKKGRRFLAAMLAMTVLNLALFGGAFWLGTQYGTRSQQANSKQELLSNLRGEKADTQGVEKTANKPELETTEIAKAVGPAVVGITSITQGQMSIFGNIGQSSSSGSGIILSSDGYIVTNNHVVEGVTSISVTLNTGSEYEAKIIGTDAQTDLAVIKIEPKEELTVATLGDSSAVEVGERVVAIGNPMGLEFFGSVTQGIVSAVNRSISVDNRTMNLIQTDAAINSGNSGGALINAYGEVIGINSVKVATSGVEGMGFAIPISEANPIISDLLEFGYVKGRPVIGITYRDVTAYMAEAYSWPQGVQVMSVTADSPREAGLQQGDIIVEVNGQAIATGEELNEIKDQHAPGDQLTFKVYKYATGQTETVTVTLSEQLPG